MKSSKKQKNSQNGISNWFLLSITSISLYFNSRIQDPFNSPKMWILLLVGSSIIGSVFISNRFYLNNSSIKSIYLVNIIFVFSLLISTLLTNNKYVAIFGETQRRIGFLSYLSMSLVMLYTIRFINQTKLKFILFWMAIVGLVSAFYGQLQHSGLDFVQWNNPYNSIIGTLGNPNFAAAFMAIMGVISLGIFFLSSIKLIYRIVFLFNSFLILYTIYLSNARQGLISFAIGAITVFIVVAYQKSKVFGRLILGTSSIAGILTILGMLQIGPLTGLMYKSSVSIRGFYWRAGIEMFKSHPIFGVGVDRYGSYFKQYREMNYSLNYGFDITSTNAHNVPIQIFATAGIFAGAAYLTLIGLIFYFGVKAIKSSEKEDKIIVSIFLAAWLSFQAQSVISIDNLGLTVWGWFLGGLIVGIRGIQIRNALATKEAVKAKLDNKYLLKLTLNTVSTIVVICLISLLYKGESNAFESRLSIGNYKDAQSQLVYASASKTFSIPLNDPSYKLSSASYLYSAGFKTEAVMRIKQIIQNDPRNLDALNLLAEIYEQIGQTQNAVETRKDIYAIDPWNAKNLLKLGNLYKYLHDFESMSKIQKNILSFASKTPEGQSALSELVSQ